VPLTHAVSFQPLSSSRISRTLRVRSSEFTSTRLQILKALKLSSLLVCQRHHAMGEGVTHA
jgi:hypothetical protein